MTVTTLCGGKCYCLTASCKDHSSACCMPLCMSQRLAHTQIFLKGFFVPMMQSPCVVPNLPCEKNLHSRRMFMQWETPTPKIFGVTLWKYGRDRDRTGDQLIWNQSLYRWVTRPYNSLREFYAYQIRTAHRDRMSTAWMIRMKIFVNPGRNCRSICI